MTFSGMCQDLRFDAEYLFFKNALNQTDWKKDVPAEDNWKTYMSRVCEDTDFLRDVRPFLERPGDMDVFSKENILEVLKG